MIFIRKSKILWFFKVDSAVISNSNDDEHSIIRQDITTSPIFKPWPVNTTVCYEYVGKFKTNFFLKINL